MRQPEGSGDLLIGIGNRMRGDDAAGLLVAARARELGQAGLDIREMEGEPIDLIEAITGAGCVFIADATCRGVPAGTVVRLEVTGEPLPAGISPPSTHALGLAEAIEIARGLGRLPPRLVVYGLEGRDFAPGAPVCGEVRAGVEEVARAILSELAQSPVCGGAA